MGATMRTLMHGLRQWLGIFILLYACLVAVPANAAVTAGTISFAGTSGNTVTQQYNGLSFTQGEGWVYDDGGGFWTGFTSPSITPLNGTSGGPGIVKVVNANDRFNLTEVKVLGYGSQQSVTVQAYRSGSPVGSALTLTSTNDTTFSTHTVSLTNIDELRFYNDDGYFSVDDLVVEPYAASLSLSPTTLSAATVAAAYSQTITASGGTPGYTYAITAGALPAGVTLNGGTGALSGTPTAGGSFNFTITATDSTGGTPMTGSQAYTLTVNAPTISVSPTSLPGGTLSVAYSQAITASGGTAPYTYAVPPGTLPAGMSLSSAGVLSGTPTASGTFNFTVTASDSSGGTGPYAGARAYALTITAAPTATTGAASTITATGATLGGTVSSNGASTTVTFEYGLTASYGSSATASQSPLAAGASGSSVSAAITGLSCNTTYHFRVTAVNSVGTTNGSDATFTTSACAPSVTTGSATSITASGATLGGTVSSGGASTTVTFEYGLTTGYGSSASASQSPLSAGASNSSVSAAISSLSCGTTYHFRATASSSAGTTNGSDTTFATAACGVPGAPTIGTATAGNAQASVTFTPPASDGGSAITSYTATSNPSNITGTCVSSPCTVTGLTNGTAYTFTVTATNGVGTGTASAASNSVTPKAPQTITFNDPGAQNFGTTTTLTATASSNLTPTFSSSTTGVCTITSGGALTFVTAGSCTINADQAGDASYLPATQVSQTFNVNAVQPGAPTIGTATAGDTQASVAFTAPTNTGGTTITSYTVTVNPAHVAPVNGASSPIVVPGLTNGQAYTFTVTATNSAGTGPASAASNSITPAAIQTITFANPGAQNFGTSPTLTASSDSGLTVSFTSSTTGVCTITTGGTLTFVTAGSCTINADQAGNASYLPATQVTRSFTVNAVVPGAPTGVSATAGNGQATVSFTAPASNGGSAITSYTVTSNPGGFTGTGVASPIAVTGLTNGVTYTFTVTATNSAGLGAASTASSGVTPADAPPVAGVVSATVAYGSSNNAITLALSGSTATSVAVASAPAHGTATASGTSISYTPSPTYSGSDSFTYTASNAGGTSAPATVTITVNPLAPVAGNVSLTVDVNSSNNVVPLNLSGGAAASVAIATAPSHGVATVSGTSITYTPTSGYMGADSFTYTATNATDTSAPGTVTLLVQSRPDPTKDAEVTGLVNAQVTVANRFAQAQIGNFQSHLEGLHRHSRGGAAGARSLSSRRSPTDPWGEATTDDAANSDNTDNSATSPRVLSGRAFSGKRAVSATTSGRDSVTSTSAQPGNILATSTGLDGFVLPQAKNNAGSPSLASLLPWSLTSLNLAGKHGDVLGNGLEIWTAGVINIGKQSDTDTRFTTSGISIGADQRLGEDLTVGIGAGFGHERQKIGDNGTRNDGDSYSFVVYGSYQPTDAIFLDGLIGYGDIDFDSTRYVTALGDKARSARRGAQWFSSLSGGYDYLMGKSLLSTYGRFDLVSTRLKRSTETGGGIYNLTYFEQDTSTKKLAIGVRGETQFEWSAGSVKPYFRVEFQHNLDTPGSAEMAYADQLYKVYELEIDGVDRNTLVLGLGSDLLLKKDLRLGLGYRYSHGSESTRMHALRFDLRKAF